MTASLDEILSLETLDVNLFRSRYHRENFRKSLFGGQVLGQALMAMTNTVKDTLPTSCHAYFLRAGTSDAPVIYDVEVVRDGNSISSRRVVARQHGRPIFHMSASFHKEEEGFEHQLEKPTNIPSPEEIIKTHGLPQTDQHIAEINKTSANRPQMDVPFILLPVDENLFTSRKVREPEAYFWLKTNAELPDSPIFHLSALAFASDLGLLATSLLPHSVNLFDRSVFAASIDHAMWFHSNDFKADDWMLYKTESPWAGKARGYTQGSIFRRDGLLIATTTQEGLIRPSEELLSKI